MSKASNVALCAMLFTCFLVNSCAQTKQYTPRPAAANYQLPGLPANIVTVQVNDLRPDANTDDGLQKILKGQVMAALSAEPSYQTANRYVLAVDIVEHRSFFTLGNWNASTHFRIRLGDASGNAVGQWDARGTAHRSNMWGYATAEAVSQDSYNIAVADMMSILSSVSVR